MNGSSNQTRVLDAAVALLARMPEKRMNAVVLNKALFYFDLNCMLATGETYTGRTYLSLDNGPALAKYERRLINPLVEAGLARQLSEGQAKPIALTDEGARNVPRLPPALDEIAARVANQFAGRSSTWASDYSHENLGWRAARSASASQKGVGPIDMLLAMQQLIDDDPWMDDSDTETQAAFQEVANLGASGGEPW